jgi:hypothetical protein
VTLSGNQGSVELGGNQIGGRVIISNNVTGGSGESGVEVEGNHIGGTLSCSGNTPPPTNDGQPNTVTGARTGQCTGL